MRVNQILNFMKTKINFSQNRNSLDMTSFGSQQKVINDSNSQLISKEATEALKNKYMSNISFDGYHKSVEVKVCGHFEPYTVTHYYNPLYLGTAGNTWTSEEKRFVPDVYKARFVGSDKIGQGEDSNTAIRVAIVNTDNFTTGTRIEKNNNAIRSLKIRTPEPKKIPEENEKNSVEAMDFANVYFSDPNEEVPSIVRRDCDYIVYAPGSKDADERSFWEKLLRL